MSDREKLFDLMMRDPCPSPALCSVHCKYYKSQHCHAERYADHLIANGVTFATDNNVGGKWIPVTERLPEKMGKYVCRYVFGENTDYPFEQVLWYYPQLEKPHFQHEGSMGLRVTHWMPLPEPPKGE